MTSSVLTRYVASSSDEVTKPTLLDTHKTYRTKWGAKHAASKKNSSVFKVRIQYKNWLVRYVSAFFNDSLHKRSALTLGGMSIMSALVLGVLLYQGKVDDVLAMTIPAILFTFYTYDILTDAWLYMLSRKQTFEPIFSTLVVPAVSFAAPTCDQTDSFFDYWDTGFEAGANAQLITV